MVTFGHRNAKGDLKSPVLFSVEDSNVVFSVGLHNFIPINRDLCVCEARVILTA